MKISLLSPFIRVDFFREYKKREYESISYGWKTLKDRDQKHRDLNKEWGFAESDGSYGVGCKSYAQIDYLTKYKKIENDGNQNFTASNQKFYQWRDKQYFTIQEYLFLIDFFPATETIDEAFAEAQIDDGLIFDSLSLHASHLIKGSRNSVQTFKGTDFEVTFLESVQMKIDAKNYEKKRIHKFLKIGLLNHKEKQFINRYYADLAIRVKFLYSSNN